MSSLHDEYLEQQQEENDTSQLQDTKEEQRYKEEEHPKTWIVQAQTECYVLEEFLIEGADTEEEAVKCSQTGKNVVNVYTPTELSDPRVRKVGSHATKITYLGKKI
jgi:hypothetical protein